MSEKRQKINTAIITGVGIALALALASGCGLTKYQTMRLTISAGRAATAVANNAVKQAIQDNQAHCATKCKADPACIAACTEPMDGAREYVDKGIPMAAAGWDAMAATVNLAEAAEAQGKPFDWAKLLDAVKSYACLTARGLGFLKGEAKQKLQWLIDAMGTWGCSGSPVVPAPRPPVAPAPPHRP
jgi:hypothetical protein